ncbi:rod shape-determining protein MreD [Novosphingobium terrae]|uniref:rod shape-determining protein MreD n=1 Tax=Novosphingobium terrae TaxID=2726189 RepID=UPI00197F76DE|nr:rod shape-determining protein MreD [Novosphingobium terrae]
MIAPSAKRRRLLNGYSPILAYITPWVAIVLASCLPLWPVIASAPIMPPFGFLMLLAWRQLRPGLLPVWSGAILGLFDDLVSGQPMGSAITLWSATMLALDVIEARFPWRNFITEWLVAALMIAAYVLLGLGIANAAMVNPAGGMLLPLLVAPQIGLSVLVYPLVGRAVAAMDRWRLRRYRVVS